MKVVVVVAVVAMVVAIELVGSATYVYCVF